MVCKKICECLINTLKKKIDLNGIILVDSLYQAVNTSVLFYKNWSVNVAYGNDGSVL